MDYSKEIRELGLMAQTYATFFSVTNKLQILGDSYLENVTVRQYMILLAIAHLSEDDTTLVNIARKLGTSKQSANKLLTNLQNKGYIASTPSKRDKRAINVAITETGIQVLLECSKKSVEFMADIFNDFTCKELETLWNLLKKLYNFDGEEQDGFEEDVNYKFNHMEGYQEAQTKALEEFALRRNRNNKEASPNE
ncbi:MAG: MarR family transcriptional regulator [Lachnospiraceae bacterium]|nr:MarR family transcriptional regulator [Lachnospiraceae bacterium]